MKKIINIILSSVLLLSTTSCSDFLKEYSQDEAKVESWKDLDELLVGDGYLKTSCIDEVNGSSSSNSINYNFEILNFMSDELTESTSDKAADQIGSFRTRYFSYYTWQKELGTDENMKYTGGDEAYWNRLYQYISTTNIILSLIDKQKENTTADHEGKQRVKGEAAFLRAAYYLMLVNMYAKPYNPETAETTLAVPVKTTEYIEDKEFARATLKQVYDQILSDLNTAETNLEGKQRVSVYRADITAAYLLHSRVALYMQDWDEAERYAQKVIEKQPALLNLRTYGNESEESASNSSVISKDSPETIFSMGGYMSAFAFWDNEDAGSTYTVSDDIMKLYQEDDLRLKYYIGSSHYNETYPISIKVDGQKSGTAKVQDVSDCFLLRTSEAYLNLAEAAAYKNDEQTAKQALQTFLNHRLSDNANISASGKELIDEIRNERAKEFLMEGQRWFDLRRYTVCQPYPWSKTITHGHTYFVYDSYDWEWTPSYTDYYILQTNDEAYTLPVPRPVRQQQASLGGNERPERPASYTTRYN